MLALIVIAPWCSRVTVGEEPWWAAGAVVQDCAGPQLVAGVPPPGRLSLKSCCPAADAFAVSRLAEQGTPARGGQQPAPNGRTVRALRLPNC